MEKHGESFMKRQYNSLQGEIARVEAEAARAAVEARRASQGA